MEIALNNKQIYLIIQRFNSKFRLRKKKDCPNPKSDLFTINDIYLFRATRILFGSDVDFFNLIKILTNII